MFPGDAAGRRGNSDKVRFGAWLAETGCAPNPAHTGIGTQQSIAKASKAEALEEVTSRKKPHSNPILSPVMILCPRTPLGMLRPRWPVPVDASAGELWFL